MSICIIFLSLYGMFRATSSPVQKKNLGIKNLNFTGIVSCVPLIRGPLDSYDYPYSLRHPVYKGGFSSLYTILLWPAWQLEVVAAIREVKFFLDTVRCCMGRKQNNHAPTYRDMARLGFEGMQAACEIPWYSMQRKKMTPSIASICERHDPRKYSSCVI